ncbi:MAG: class I SAM-dependent methyltransferase [Candidatus Omnitrophica bacterium]|nr:class I SAM-dependent methyltransferase [Candidatus Omnitrophota bacterium]
MDKIAGQIYNDIRHEDAQNMTFSDEQFDVVVSNDVFEHVPDVQAALRESCRVLKRGGVMIFSIPFYVGHDISSQRVKLDEGKPIFIKSPMYHGNPVDENGSLVFHDFGWDFLKFCREAGFSDAYMMDCYDPLKGYISELFSLFIAGKQS